MAAVMNPAKLQLNQYYFPHQEVRANPAHDPSGIKNGAVVSFALNAGLSPTDNHQHFVEIVAEVDESASTNPAYFFKIQAFGLFTTDDGLTQDEAKALVAAYGSQVLVGSIRDHLVSLTSRGPWGSFYLNVITLHVQPKVNA